MENQLFACVLFLGLSAGAFSSAAAPSVKPVVTLTGPAAYSKVYTPNSILTLTGTAAAPVPGVLLDSVSYCLNGAENGTNPITGALEGTHAISWSAKVDFSRVPGGRLGSNGVTVFAFDQYSNRSTLVSRTFYWVATNPASWRVEPPGAGQITGVKQGQVLTSGTGYKISAAPASSQWAFLEWTNSRGKILTNKASFNYMDSADDGTLTAVFKPNPYLEMGGSYTGLFVDINILDLDPNNIIEPSDVGPTNSGYIQVTVTKTGTFTGKLCLPSAGLPFTLGGQFELTTSNALLDLPPIKVSDTEYLDVYMKLNTGTNIGGAGTGIMSGRVSAFNSAAKTDMLWHSEISAELSLYKSNNTRPGQYNIAISPGFGPNSYYRGDASDGPGGYGYMTATVGKTGAVAMTLHLADGTTPSLSSASAMARDGTCPFYASLYGGKGMILGWLQISNGIPVQGEDVCWVKLPEAGAYYTHGFSVSPPLYGGLYVPPEAGTNLFGATALSFTADTNYTAGMSLPEETQEPVTFNPATGAFTDTNKVSVALTPSSGQLKGSFTAPGAKTSTSFSGLMVGNNLASDSFNGIGFYASTNHETGPLNLNAPVNAFPFIAEPEKTCEHQP